MKEPFLKTVLLFKKSSAILPKEKIPYLYQAFQPPNGQRGHLRKLRKWTAKQRYDEDSKGHHAIWSPKAFLIL